MSTFINNPPSAIVPRRQDIQFSINSNVGATAAQDMRSRANVPTNVSPYIVEFAGTISCYIMNNNQTQDWTSRIIINGTPVGDFTRNNGLEIQEFNPMIAVNKDDEIRIRYISAASQIRRPSVQLIITEAV